MTVRRTLGTGPQTSGHGIRAAQADLLNTLPGIHLPDLDPLRDRGVLGSQPPTSPSQRRRTLGVGDHPNDEPAS
ncbi:MULTISPECIES: hypothetical protein [Streptomyces]|uniref:Uncharacterized protein n=1 Tax=Streptomyces galilaeus TaxID=33899 RepID=A0ABW9IZV9_STRGJ